MDTTIYGHCACIQPAFSTYRTYRKTKCTIRKSLKFWSRNIIKLFYFYMISTFEVLTSMHSIYVCLTYREAVIPISNVKYHYLPRRKCRHSSWPDPYYSRPDNCTSLHRPASRFPKQGGCYLRPKPGHSFWTTVERGDIGLKHMIQAKI